MLDSRENEGEVLALVLSARHVYQLVRVIGKEFKPLEVSFYRGR